MSTMFERKCLMCGQPLPEGVVASRKYCNDCGIQRKRESEAKRREVRKSMRELAKKEESESPKQQKPARTISEKDRRYCAKCIYRGRYTAGYLCNYICMTGERRGCPPGVGCTRKLLASQFETTSKIRICERCGVNTVENKYARFCNSCRLELRRMAAYHMIEVKNEKEKG